MSEVKRAVRFYTMRDLMQMWMPYTCDQWQEAVKDSMEPHQCPVCGCFPEVVDEEGSLLYVHGSELLN